MLLRIDWMRPRLLDEKTYYRHPSVNGHLWHTILGRLGSTAKAFVVRYLPILVGYRNNRFRSGLFFGNRRQLEAIFRYCSGSCPSQPTTILNRDSS